jgi:hypothetical protein
VEETNAYERLVGRRLGRHILRIVRREWEDNIKMVLKEIIMRMGGEWNWIWIVSFISGVEPTGFIAIDLTLFS